MSFLLVALGGGFGAIVRSIASSRWNRGSFNIPIGTWFVNISGSLLLAYLILLRSMDMLPETLWLFAGIGFCGSFTTFSTFGKETATLILEGYHKKAVSYVLASLVVSLSVVILVFLIH